MNPSPSIRDEDISRRAHQNWEVAGKPDGQDTAHWLQAERELHAERAKTAEPPVAHATVAPPFVVKHVPERAPHSANYVHPGVTTDSLHHRRR